MKLSQICINRPVFAIVINLLVLFAGYVAYQKLNVREYPNVDRPIVSVSTGYPGASAQIVESKITKTLEDALGGVSGLDYIESSSSNQHSNISLYFKPNKDVELASNDIRDKVNRTKKMLPKEADEPVIAKSASDTQPIIWLAFFSKTRSVEEISMVVDTSIKQQLEAIDGVSSVVVFGNHRPAMRIWLDIHKLAGFDLTVQDVSTAIRGQNLEIPSGEIKSQDMKMIVYSKTDLNTVSDFENIIIREKDGYLIKLRDVSKVELGEEDDDHFVRYLGSTTLAIGLIKQSTANPLNIRNTLKELQPKLEQSLPEGVSMELAFDSTIPINASIHAVFKTIFEAILLVVLVIFLFLRNLKSTLIPVITIPLSLIGSFAIMAIFGFSINTLTLLAMVLAIGLVVDDAIVVLENIHRHKEAGLSPMDAAKKGMGEISTAVIAMTLTLVAVFIPLAFLEGRIGKLFIEFAFVLAGTVLISGFTALTLTPMMCARLPSEVNTKNQFYQGIETILQASTKSYKWFLLKSLQFKVAGLVLIALIFVANALLYKNLKQELTPPEDKGYYLIIGNGPLGATGNYVDRYAQTIEAQLQEQGPVNRYFLVGGYPSSNGAIAFVGLKPWEERSESVFDAIGAMTPNLSKNTGLQAFAFPPQSEIAPGFGSNFTVVLRYAGSYEQLSSLGDKVKAKVQQIKGLTNVETNLKLDNPELNMHINRNLCGQMGVNIDNIGSALQVLYSGQEMGYFKLDGKQYPILVEASAKFTNDANDLNSVHIRSQNNELLPLGHFIKLEESIAAQSLNRFNKLPALSLTANIDDDTDVLEALSQVQTIIQELSDPKLSVDYTGPLRAFVENQGTMLVTFVLALIVVFLVLSAQFESFISPFIILFSVPLGILGALLTMNTITGSLNIFSQIGLITLIGLITKHGILIVEFANQKMEEGQLKAEAIVQASLSRFRPILMTTAATVLGALPLALSTGAGSEGRSHIGWCIVGGMLIGTFLTLFIVPLLYSVIRKD